VREVAIAEEQIGSRFPNGYGDYVQRLGAGTLNDLLNVWLPQKVLEARETWRDQMTAYWFWDDQGSDVNQSRAMDAIPFADSELGWLCFHPDDPDTVIVLPRDVERTYAVGPGLESAIIWMFSSGVLQQPTPASAFETPLGRKHVRHGSSGPAQLEPVRAALVALGEHALVDLPDDEGYSVVYFPSIQGKVTLLRLSQGEIDGLIVHDEDAPPAAVARVQHALELAGLTYQTSW
jgi:hypothetical protein